MAKTDFWDKALLAGAVCLLAAGTLCTALFPAPRYSPIEKRQLAAFPEFSVNEIADGSVSRALEDFATERFLLRAPCRAFWSGTQLALGQREAHGVILCRDGSLSRRIETDAAIYAKNLAMLQRLQKSAGRALTVAVAPRRLEARSEVLPFGYDTANERADWAHLPAECITFFDCTADACWYRTDHHWTQNGAYFAYVRLGEALGYTPHPRADFCIEDTGVGFWGSSAAAAGLARVAPDAISLWHYAGEEALCVRRDGKPASFTGVYDREKLLTGEGYDVFFGGNCAQLEISRGEEDPRPLLVVIKDSFASSLLPFLSRHFRILAIDPRYASFSLSELLSGEGQALVLCGMQTLVQSPFLSLLRP